MYKVVVVEDEYLLRLGLIQAMPWREHNCQVVGEAEDADEGVRLAKNLRPDIIITDIHLSGRDGLSMIGEIKESLDCEFIILSGYSEFEYAKQAVSLGVRGYLLKPMDDDEFLRVLDETIGVIKRKRKYDRLLERYEHAPRENETIDSAFLAKESANPGEKYLSSAIEYIRGHYAEDLTVKTVSEKLNISDSYLSKLFKANTNYTFHEYITLQRIRASMQLLDQTDYKTYHIAEMVGYQDARYFSDTFKKIVGMSPAQYRKR